jgi:hypothetical protein
LDQQIGVSQRRGVVAGSGGRGHHHP